MTTIRKSGEIYSDFIVADFNDWLKLYKNNGSGIFLESKLSLNGAFNYAEPGSVASIKMKDGSVRIVAASYRRPNPQWDPSGNIIIFGLINDVLVESLRYSYPVEWTSKNLGAFAIIPFDPSNNGYDDFIVLGEGDGRSVLYFKQTTDGFVDATEEKLGAVKTKMYESDKFVVFDANGDGKKDLMAFSYKNNIYSSGNGLFINQGDGVLKSVQLGGPELADTIQIPIFTTNKDGSWKKFIGLYGVKLDGSQLMTVKAWIK
ncbi:hypothetical protein E6Q11_06620 [Candidatus Dojkabacteria bacterium]|uniref:VCBS repeat-containing protein n=1 Tax=Candidatus Dojkabacteria bacterium TaxID=2099670 RepID=A0A5C7J391_9BACT|nr:MAG: hypothetical protein E6Q11_06620 [Candidatus Dojkabacteria bacterium]